jgi:hypothetical protein
MNRARSLLGHGWGRAALLAFAAAAVLSTSGWLAAIYYRPYGHDVRAQLAHGWPGARVSLASGLQVAHLVSALALGLAVVILLVVRPWRIGGPPRARLVLLAVLAALFAGTGWVEPWDRLLPWSPAIGANLARPMPLGQQGPFAELVGVNVRYDQAMFTLARRRWGVKAAGRVYYAHVIGLPVLAGLFAIFLRRRQA